MTASPPIDAPRRRGRPKTRSDDDVRRAIVEIAERTFLELGYGATTTDEIAARARISKQTLYRVFPAKAEIFAAVVEHHRPRMLALPGPWDDLPLAEALAQIFHADIDAAGDRERMKLIWLVMRESHLFPELRRAVVHNGIRRSRDDLAVWLAERAARGELPALDFRRCAIAMMDLVLGFGGEDPHDAIERPLRPDHGERVRWCIGVFLNGILPR